MARWREGIVASCSFKHSVEPVSDKHTDHVSVWHGSRALQAWKQSLSAAMAGIFRAVSTLDVSILHCYKGPICLVPVPSRQFTHGFLF